MEGRQTTCGKGSTMTTENTREELMLCAMSLLADAEDDPSKHKDVNIGLMATCVEIISAIGLARENVKPTAQLIDQLGARIIDYVHRETSAIARERN